MSKIRILKETIHRIMPFSHLKIGDPMYFDEIDNGSDNVRLQELTCNLEIPDCKCGATKIEKIMYEDQNTEQSGLQSYTIIKVSVYLANSNKQLDTYLADKWFGEKSVKQRKQLGCDTAKYLLEVDERSCVIDSTADGYYGELLELKCGYGMMLYLWFDNDITCYEEVCSLMEYLFNFFNFKEVLAVPDRGIKNNSSDPCYKQNSNKNEFGENELICRVVIESDNGNTIKVVKALCATTGLSVEEATDCINKLPFTLEYNTLDVAKKAAEALKRAGAKVTVFAC